MYKFSYIDICKVFNQVFLYIIVSPRSPLPNKEDIILTQLSLLAPYGQDGGEDNENGNLFILYHT